jgi:hypothetical protein
MRNFFVQYFSNSNHGGLVLSGTFSRALTSSRVKFVYYVWVVLCSVSLFSVGLIGFSSSFICLLLSRYFFVYLRYRSVGRGNGAPGFMSYWTILYGCLFQFFSIYNFNESTVYTLMKFDFAIVMLSAAYYKQKNGYLSGRGIEFGLQNQMWAYAYKHFQRYPKNGLVYRVLNFSSVVTEYVIFLALMIPLTTKFAGFLICITFVFLGIFVRLGTLPLTMIFLGLILANTSRDQGEIIPFPILDWIFLGYFFLLVLSLLWAWIYFLKIEIPLFVKPILKISYTITGSIIWSVFTARLTENLIIISRKTDWSETPLYSKDFGVHSGISLTTLATYLDYFPADRQIQEERIKQYLKTMFKDDYEKNMSFYKIAINPEGVSLQHKITWTFIPTRDELVVLK